MQECDITFPVNKIKYLSLKGQSEQDLRQSYVIKQ
jgi:hypothetical protein